MKNPEKNKGTPGNTYATERKIFSIEPSSSIFDYEIQLIKNKLNSDPSSFNDLDTIVRVTQACNFATQGQNKMAVEMKEKYDNVKNDYDSLNLKYEVLKITSKNEKNQLTQELQKLRKQLQDLNRIYNIQQGLVKDNQQKLAQKDDAIRKLEIKNKEYILKAISTFAQKISMALKNNQKRPGSKILHQDTNPNTYMDFALDEIDKKIDELKNIKRLNSNMTTCMQRLINVEKSIQHARYGPLSFKEGHQADIFKALRSEIQTKIINNLSLEQRQKNAFTKLNQFLESTDKRFKTILTQWAQALRLQKSTLDQAMGKSKIQTQDQQRQIKQLNAAIAEERRLKNQLKIQLQSTKKKLQVAENNLKQANVRIGQLQRQLSQAKMEIERLKQQHKEDIAQIKRLKDQEKRTQLLTLRASFQAKLNDKDKELQKQRLTNSKLTFEIKSNTTQIETLNKSAQKLNKDLQAQIQANQQMARQNRKSVISLTSKETKLAQLDKQIADLRQKKSSTEAQLKAKTSEWQKAQKDNKQKTNRISELQNQINNNLVPKLEKVTENLKQTQKQMKLALKQRTEAIQKYTYIVENPPRQYLQYFNGNILNYQSKNYLEWFVTKLQENTKRRIRSTKPLLRYDPRNRQPFHPYIDSNPFIVLIVKVWNKQIIACYSKLPFLPRSNVEFQEGYIYGLLNKKVFRVKKQATSKFNKTNPKPITYDDSYMIWGNADVRIKPGTNQLYSNYATVGGSYEQVGNENATVEDLLMFNERETVLADYEVFAVEFQDY